MSRSVFELEDVSKQFGDLRALQHVTLRVGVGERVALVGPSGAGKSTLISLLNGTQRPDSGRLYLLGKDVTSLNGRSLRELQQRIGTVYQRFYLVEQLRVVHNVNAGRLGDWSLGRALWSLIRPLHPQAAHEALTKVGIPEKLYARTNTLSGGQQQRVALARVLVQNPDAILADEPIASLDPERSREIMNLITDLVQEMNKTLIVSLHAIEIALAYCERIVGLRNGRILFDVPSEQVTPQMVQTLYRIGEV